MKIRIFSNHKIVPENHKVYVLHAGWKKKFYLDFLRHGAVFLDIPEMRLPWDFELNDDLKKELQRSHALAKYYKYPESLDLPSENLDDYHPVLGLRSADFPSMDGQTLNAVKELYQKAKAGDLVIVPGWGLDQPVLIGELQAIGEVDIPHVPVAFYKEKTIPARKVNWLNKSHSRHHFSIDFAKQLSNSRAMIRLPRSLTHEAYDYAYGDYSDDRNASISIEVVPTGMGEQGMDAQGIDALQLRSATDLALYFNSFFASISDGTVTDFLSLSISEAVRSRYYRASPVDIEYDIHSPGDVIIRTKNGARKMVFIGAMLSLIEVASATGVQVPSGDNLEVVVENKWATNVDDCDLNIDEDVRTALNFLGAERWEELCREYLEFSDSIDFDSGTIVEIDQEL